MDRYRHTGTKAIVEAIQLNEDSANEIQRLVPGIFPLMETDRFTDEQSKAFNVPTASGMKRLSEGQYLVKYAGGVGNFLVMMPGEFRTHYIPMEIPPGLITDDVRDSKIMRSRTEQDET